MIELGDRTAQANTLAGRLIIEELVRLGARDIIIAPGSRSTPLAAAAARHPLVRLRVIVDERSAAFFAIGLSRATAQPAVLITTSGSAAAHALPAIIEANTARLPLLILSADRPPERRGTGANQTIDQVHLFGRHVRHFLELPCPDSSLRPAVLLSALDHAVAMACDGPVHINLMFRKPLDPTGPAGLSDLIDLVAPTATDHPLMRRWLEGTQPFTHWPAPQLRLSTESVTQLHTILRDATAGIVVVGGIDDPAERQAARHLTTLLGWPVVADIASGLRMGPAQGTLLAHHDLMLGSAAWASATRPDVVLRLGGPLVSQAVQCWLDAAAPLHHIVIRSDRVNVDPGHGVTMRLQAHVSAVFAALEPNPPGQRAVQIARVRRWRAVAQEVSAGLPALAGEEINIARGLCAALPVGAGLWAASSMSVRLLDAFAPAGGPPVDVACARGASGIDGLIAQATGWALARVRLADHDTPRSSTSKPTDSHGTASVLLVGDLAALHDVGSLQVLAAQAPDLVVVVMNNGGGGIFSLLPIRTQSDDFEPVFAASHDGTVLPWARAAGVAAQRVESAAQLPSALAAAIAQGGPHLLELRTERETARQSWLAARRAVAQWVDQHLGAQA